jgi:hypothetical protein
VQEVLEAMQTDSGVTLQLLKVDGGMTENHLLMQFQSDILEVPVLTPQTKETTALGAAFAAGLAVGFWKNFEELRCLWSVGHKWDPYMPAKTRRNLLKDWKKAVQRTFGWVDEALAAPLPGPRKRGELALTSRGNAVSLAVGLVAVAGAAAVGFAAGLRFKPNR